MKKLALSFVLTFVFGLTLTSFNSGSNAATQDRPVIKIQKTNTLDFDWGDEDMSMPRF